MEGAEIAETELTQSAQRCRDTQRRHATLRMGCRREPASSDRVRRAITSTTELFERLWNDRLPRSRPRNARPIRRTRGAFSAWLCISAISAFIRSLRPLLALRGSSIVLLEQKRRVGAAEAEGIRQGVLYRQRAARVGHVIQVALGIGIVQIDRRRHHFMVDRKSGNAGFEPA